MATKPEVGDAVVAAESNRFLIAQWDSRQLFDLLADNLGGDRLDSQALDIIKVPSAGGKQWQVPGSDEDIMARELEGVVIHSHAARAYWPLPYGEGSGGPPDCASADGVTGVGSPGGHCFGCSWNNYGTSESGRGKACAESRMVYLLTPDRLIPLIIRVPAASVGAWKQYVVRLITEGRHLAQTLTRFTLVEEKNATGLKYSRVQPQRSGDLNEAETASVSEYTERIRPYLRTGFAAAGGLPELPEFPDAPEGEPAEENAPVAATAAAEGETA